VCVRERERVSTRVHVCVCEREMRSSCVCVCERERERPSRWAAMGLPPDTALQPPHARIHVRTHPVRCCMKTLMIYELGSMQFATQNDFYW